MFRKVISHVIAAAALGTFVTLAAACGGEPQATVAPAATATTAPVATQPPVTQPAAVPTVAVASPEATISVGTPTQVPSSPTIVPPPPPTPTPTSASAVPTPGLTATPTPAPTASAPAPTPTLTIVPSPTPAAGQPTGPKKEVGVVPSKDNTLYQSNTGDLSNGAGEYLFVGRTNSGPTRRAVIAFDVASSLPAGAKVTSATLTMHMSKSQAGGTAVRLHRVAADWGEGKSKGAGEQGGGAAAAPGDATWIHRFFDSQKWARAGADFADTESASVVVSLVGAYTWSSTAQMVADVQSWVDNPTQNFGWIIIGDETNTQTTKRFDSREEADASLRPMLTIEFIAP